MYPTYFSYKLEKGSNNRVIIKASDIRHQKKIIILAFVFLGVILSIVIPSQTDTSLREFIFVFIGGLVFVFVLLKILFFGGDYEIYLEKDRRLLKYKAKYGDEIIHEDIELEKNPKFIFSRYYGVSGRKYFRYGGNMRLKIKYDDSELDVIPKFGNFSFFRFYVLFSKNEINEIADFLNMEAVNE